MSAADVTAEYPCPCENCDRFAMSHDEYCIACLHHNCRHDAAKCPGPLQVDHCGHCGWELTRRILDRGDGLCPGCHHKQNPGPSMRIDTPQSRLVHFLEVADRSKPADDGEGNNGGFS